MEKPSATARCFVTCMPGFQALLGFELLSMSSLFRLFFLVAVGSYYRPQRNGTTKRLRTRMDFPPRRAPQCQWRGTQRPPAARSSFESERDKKRGRCRSLFCLPLCGAPLRVYIAQSTGYTGRIIPHSLALSLSSFLPFPPPLSLLLFSFFVNLGDVPKSNIRSSS